MRMHIGVAMAAKGGRTAIIGVEVKESRDRNGLLTHDFTVGLIDRVSPFTVGAARDRLSAVLTGLEDHDPCAFIDIGVPQGLALQQSTRDHYPEGLHKPHAYPGTGPRAALFSQFLQAYTKERIHFVPDLKYRGDLDKALMFYMGGGQAKDGVDLSSEDEALVVASGLALQWPKHGPRARSFTVAETDG